MQPTSQHTDYHTRNRLIASLSRQLCEDSPVSAGGRVYRMHDVQTRVNSDPDLPKLQRMLMGASSQRDKQRAAEGYQLVFRQHAYILAECLVDQVIAEHFGTARAEVMQ